MNQVKKKLAELEAQANNLRNALLRISGAIQVLDEELARSKKQKIVPHSEESNNHNAKGKSEAIKQNPVIPQK